MTTKEKTGWSLFGKKEKVPAPTLDDASRSVRTGARARARALALRRRACLSAGGRRSICASDHASAATLLSYLAHLSVFCVAEGDRVAAKCS